MTRKQRRLARELITNPPPRSALAAAKEWGVALTLLYANLLRTPTERTQSFASKVAILRHSSGRREKPALSSMKELPDILKVLAHLDFVVIGGAAMHLQGSAYVTQDVGFCYARTPQNIKRLAPLLNPIVPCCVRRGFAVPI